MRKLIYRMASNTRKRDWFSTEEHEGSDYCKSGTDSDDGSETNVPTAMKDKKQKTVKVEKGKSAVSKSKANFRFKTVSDDEDEEENESRANATAKRKSNAPVFQFGRRFESSEDEVDGSEQEEDDEAEEEDDNDCGDANKASDDEDEESYIIGASSGTDGKVRDVLRRLSTKELEDNRARIEKTGVVYLSRTPPFMKPGKVRQILSRFGELDRIFLAPEDPKSYTRRVRFGGNKKRNFVEGWVEFKDKRKAKLCASTLNGQIIGKTESLLENFTEHMSRLIYDLQGVTRDHTITTTS